MDRDCISTMREIRGRMRKKPFDAFNVHLIRYAVIICAGAVERAYKSIIADYVTQNASAENDRYVNTVVRNSKNNPRLQNINALLKQFNEKWNDDFNREIKVRASYNMDVQNLASLVEARNDVAHGKSVTCSLEDIIRYYLSARQLVSKLEVVLV